ncbi:ABC-2 type transport system permease protein [Melghirimyces profundicolus]|uniref:ABC-2 type transport system permease protein n=1 Tax=Melghirimyces profundicolus TaxID=1242148 RepID=A0A2T6C9K7_9BACL|nr:ABC transporter permease [Melghirimyces profundicolus]PTX64992.1 ABC-2 type transport system permease protein [Melghirimyces profundicolus]
MWKRIGAMVQKEFIQLRRDRRTLAIMIILPVLWLVAFGYAVNFDIDTIDVVVADEADHADSQDVIRQIEENEDFHLKGKATPGEGRSELTRGEADVLVIIPEGYNGFSREEDEKLKVQVDGSRLFSAQSALRKVNEFLLDVQKENMTQLQDEIREELEQSDVPTPDLSGSPAFAKLQRVLPPQELRQFQETLKDQVENNAREQMDARLEKMEELFPDPDRMKPEVDVLFNPDIKSVNYMIPGLVGLVLIFVTTLMTALGIVREKERGTLEQLVVSPLRSFELMLGKLFPYFLIAVVDFLLVFSVGIFLFDVPFRGEVLPFLLVSLLFLTGSLGMGLLVSMVSQNQQQAMQLAVLTLVPQFILSGFVFPLEAMPWGIRWVSCLMPLTYFLPVSRDVFLKGTHPFDYTTEVAVLAVYAVLFLGVAALRFRRSLG